MEKTMETTQISDGKCLEYLLKTGKLDLDAVREDMKKEQKKRILEAHPFSIWEGSDGRWRTKFIDELGSGKKRMIVKSKREDLEEFLFGHYAALDKQEQLKKSTLRTLYEEWKIQKSLEGSAPTTITRKESDWKRYYLKSDIIDIPIVEFNKYDLKQWTLEFIHDYNPTKNKYHNVTGIMRQMLDFAVEKEIIDVNLYRQIPIDTKKLLRQEKKASSETQVFYKDEIEEIFQWAWEDYVNKVKVYQLSPLAVLLQFQTAMRIGELCALRYEDIHDNYIHVHRMVRRDTKEVVEHTKTDAGDRWIPLTEDAKRIILAAHQRQEEIGCDTNGFVFSLTDQPLTERSIADLYRKYCKRLDGPHRSSHKARKTVISRLIDNNVSIDAIRAIVGHADERTTYKNYCFTSVPQSEIDEKFNEILRF